MPAGEATVKTQLRHTFGKLGVDDRTAALVAALERASFAYQDEPGDPVNADLTHPA